MDKPNVISIIPARGGSKGIPRKNVAMLGGRPLIAHTISAARAAVSIDRVIVSTDDAELSSLSERYGAEVVQRPDEISGDQATSEMALLHVVEYLQQQEQFRPDIVVFLQCTSPLTSPDDIDGTVQALLAEDADTAVAVVDFHYFIWKRDGEGNAVGVNHDKRFRQLRQDREPEFLEAGAVYAMKCNGLLEHKHRFFGKTALYSIPQERVVEIDDPLDLLIAEQMCRRIQKEKRNTLLPRPIAGVVFDFDGVMTDNRVYVQQDGIEQVACSRSDGHGISLLRNAGVEMLVLSREHNPVVQARCAKLQIECKVGVDDKPTQLRLWAKHKQIDLEKLVFVGNDVPDVECMQAVGLGVAVADAHPIALKAAGIILNSRGGDGAIRELADDILKIGETIE